MTIADTIQEIVTKLVYDEVSRAQEEAAGAIRMDGGRGLSIYYAVEKIMRTFALEELIRWGIPTNALGDVSTKDLHILLGHARRCGGPQGLTSAQARGTLNHLCVLCGGFKAKHEKGIGCESFQAVNNGKYYSMDGL